VQEPEPTYHLAARMRRQELDVQAARALAKVLVETGRTFEDVKVFLAHGYGDVRRLRQPVRPLNPEHAATQGAGTVPRCSTCRGSAPPKPRPAHYRFWLERFDRKGALELSRTIWPPA
jgi:hypothetical protein